MSDVPPGTTDVRATDATGLLKATTTVAMHGVLDLGDGDRVHLYGTPGQERFDFMWQMLSGGAIGLVLLVPNDHPDPLAELGFFLQASESLVDRTRLVVGVTRTDRRRDPSLADHRRVLAERSLHVPLFEIDARRTADMSLLVQALLLCVDPRLDATAGTAGRHRRAAIPAEAALTRARPESVASRRAGVPHQAGRRTPRRQ